MGYRGVEIEGDPSNLQPIETADLFEVLSARRRRIAILLVAQEGEMEMGEMATRMANAENEGYTTSKDRKREYIPLTQSHAEKLDEAGVLELDEKANSLRPTAMTEAVADYITEGFDRFACWEGVRVLRGDNP